MSSFIKRYLNEIISMAVLALLVVALVDGQVLSHKAGAEAESSPVPSVIAQKQR